MSQRKYDVTGSEIDIILSPFTQCQDKSTKIQFRGVRNNEFFMYRLAKSAKSPNLRLIHEIGYKVMEKIKSASAIKRKK